MDTAGSSPLGRLSSHLFAQGLTGHEDPVLLVITGGRGPKESQTDAVSVLGGDVSEELGRLQDPGPGTSFEQHLLRGAEGHQGNRGGVHSLWEQKEESVPSSERHMQGLPSLRGHTTPLRCSSATLPVLLVQKCSEENSVLLSDTAGVRGA